MWHFVLVRQALSCDRQIIGVFHKVYPFISVRVIFNHQGPVLNWHFLVGRVAHWHQIGRDWPLAPATHAQCPVDGRLPGFDDLVPHAAEFGEFAYAPVCQSGRIGTYRTRPITLVDEQHVGDERDGHIDDSLRLRSHDFVRRGTRFPFRRCLRRLLPQCLRFNLPLRIPRKCLPNNKQPTTTTKLSRFEIQIFVKFFDGFFCSGSLGRNRWCLGRKCRRHRLRNRRRVFFISDWLRRFGRRLWHAISVSACINPIFFEKKFYKWSKIFW